MTLLEKYYYENVDIETPKAADNILEILEPIINKDLVTLIDELLGEVLSASGLDGFKQGFELAKSLNEEGEEHK